MSAFIIRIAAVLNITARDKPRKGVKLFFYTASHEQPLPPIYIRIGQTTSEDLLCDLGSPLRIFYKEDDRMTIHAAKGPQEPDEGCTSHFDFFSNVLGNIFAFSRFLQLFPTRH